MNSANALLLYIHLSSLYSRGKHSVHRNIVQDTQTLPEIRAQRRNYKLTLLFHVL